MTKKITCPYCKRPTTIEMRPNSEDTMRCSYPCGRLFAVRVFQGVAVAAKIDWNGKMEAELSEARAEIEGAIGLCGEHAMTASEGLYCALAISIGRLRASSEKKDALIEQMKELLSAIEKDCIICFDVDGKSWFEARDCRTRSG